MSEQLFDGRGLPISPGIVIPEQEIEFSAIRAQGAGGQHVNKVATAVHLRFDIRASSLPAACKERLLQLRRQCISRDGVIVIKAQQYRSQRQNRQAALRQLQKLIRDALQVRKKRIPTRPSREARKKRLEAKKLRGRIKRLRGKVFE